MSNLKVLVSYVAFHPDNYQGGSGESFSFKRIVDVPTNVCSFDVVHYVTNEILRLAKQGTAHSDVYDFKVTIQKIELLF